MKSNKKSKSSKKQRRNQGRPSVTRVNRPGFADRLEVPLIYEDVITLAPGVYYGVYQFRGNSVYDPDYTSTGHQPRYYDTYALIYEKYRVLKSSIHICAINGTAGSGSIFGILPHTDALSTTNWSYFAELPMAKVSSQVMPVASRYGVSLRHSSSTFKACGTTLAEASEEDYGAAVTANPARVWYWSVFFSTIDAATSVAVSFRVRLVYHVSFYERDDISQSFDVARSSRHLVDKTLTRGDQYEKYVKDEVANGRKKVRAEAPDVYNKVQLVTPVVKS